MSYLSATKNHRVVNPDLDLIRICIYFSISKFFSHFRSFWLGFGQFSVGGCAAVTSVANHRSDTEEETHRLREQRGD